MKKILFITLLAFLITKNLVLAQSVLPPANSGDLFVASATFPGVISRINPNGNVSTFITFPATTALPDYVSLAFDPLSQSLFIGSPTGSPSVILKADSNGNVSQFVSVPFSSGFVTGLAFDSPGNLYAGVRMFVFGPGPPNETGGVLKIDPDGNISNFANLPSAAGNRCIAFDKTGNLVVATDDDQIFKIGPGGNVSLFATLPRVAGGARLRGMAFDKSGNLFVSKSGNTSGAIQKVDVNGNVSTFIESFGASCPNDLTSNYGIAFDSTDALFIANFSGYCRPESVLKIDTNNGNISPFVSGLPFQPSALAFEILSSVHVAIDIKPDSSPNIINLGSNGTVPVAIFSTPAFDATTVIPTTVTLASAPVKLKGNGTAMASREDVNRDGLMDLVVHVSTQALQLSEVDTEAVLEGETTSGQRIRGSDSVKVVP